MAPARRLGVEAALAPLWVLDHRLNIQLHAELRDPHVHGTLGRPGACRSLHCQCGHSRPRLWNHGIFLLILSYSSLRTDTSFDFQSQFSITFVACIETAGDGERGADGVRAGLWCPEAIGNGHHMPAGDRPPPRSGLLADLPLLVLGTNPQGDGAV